MFFFLLMDMATVLSVLISICHSLHQSEILSSALCNFKWSEEFVISEYIIQSSAKSLTLMSMLSVISLI
uniref:Putative secreted protein n=1 Tax=Ixodes ricinus TaxID=34613 RepID=A0A6B0U1R1_IXORI